MRIPFASAVRAAALAFLVLATASCATPSPYPELKGRRVVDEAHILPAAVQADLTAKLTALEAATTDQLEVVTVTTLGGQDIADYGRNLGNRWGIGQKDKNNGVLLVVAPRDRKVRIAVGYGLETTLTDERAARIIQDVILPRFRAGDLPGGVTQGADAIIARLMEGGAHARAQITKAAA